MEQTRITAGIATSTCIHGWEWRNYGDCPACADSNSAALITAQRMANSSQQAQDEIERLRAALKSIAELHPDKDSDEGFNEWGEADCFRKAQTIAGAALAKAGQS